MGSVLLLVSLFFKLCIFLIQHCSKTTLFSVVSMYSLPIAVCTLAC
ncbi:E5 [Tursiops truncatus papillomavirus 3]|uniref:E5 n=1 Tax=Tursiops truncatus papillomavirus type 3 TaxID=496865 RepID=B4XYF1_9PAPI|nr:E5 [Tursiops truncatus papillomavirus type 3]